MQVTPPESCPPLVILPGFGNKTEDYTEPFGEAEGSMVSNLECRGFTTYTVPVRPSPSGARRPCPCNVTFGCMMHMCKCVL
jgi:hypothetical protein